MLDGTAVHLTVEDISDTSWEDNVAPDSPDEPDTTDCAGGGNCSWDCKF
jgi:hypothetical protein